MIQTIPSAQRHHVDAGWLDARWHFSFADYHDPANMSFGPLRVFNDDVVQPGQGFDMHPHRDMEIITYVISGALQHRDHLGHKQVVRGGDVQVMSAGKGILHAETNPSDTEPVHLLQFWIQPRTSGGAPRYGDRHFDLDERRNRLLPVVSHGDIDDIPAINQDATVYAALLDAGRTVTHEQAPHRRMYLFVIDGAIRLNGQSLSQGDQARMTNETIARIEAMEPAHVLLIDLP